MGIPGIYKELGPGERTALSKLAVQCVESKGRPFRVAIDISIWQFQIQLGQGGKNAALRTLYYRLVKLLGLAIQPLFVFDGPYRPSVKRGHTRAPFTASVDNFLTKQLLKLFGFPFHDAPGEAEAECALFQKTGLVDAVLSEDVDTIMFGSRLSLRNWTSEGNRANKSPTHVDVYRTDGTGSISGLDSDGMILVALMSGGDYDQDGIDKCGMKIACRAARAGFGKSLCRINKNDGAALQKWRDDLQHELRTDEHGYFQRKQKTFVVPDSFPDKKVLGYYTHPVVSSADKVQKLSESICWTKKVDIPDLRTFVEEAFNWTYLIGAKHFIRGLAPALLVQKLIARGLCTMTDHESMGSKEAAECHLIKSVSAHRKTWVTDGEAELRVAYTPNDIVGLDLDAEEDVATGPPEDDIENLREDDVSDNQSSQRQRSPTKHHDKFEPNAIVKNWMLESYVKLGAPLLVETWEEDMRDPKKFVARKAREKKKLVNSTKDSQQGKIDQFVKIAKPSLPIEPPTPVKTAKGTFVETSPERSAKFKAPPSLQAQALCQNRKTLGDKVPRNSVKKTWARTGKENVGDSPGRSLGSSQLTDPHCSSSDRSSQSVTKLGHDGQGKSLDTLESVRNSRRLSEESSQRKRTPLQLANEIYLEGRLMTPEATPRKSQSTLDHFMSKTNTPVRHDKVSRKLDLEAPVRSVAASHVITLEDSDDEEDLPSLPALLSPPPSQPATSETVEAHSTIAISKQHHQSKKTRKMVRVRESLAGAWQSLEPEDYTWQKERIVFEDVQIIDMTTD